MAATDSGSCRNGGPQGEAAREVPTYLLIDNITSLGEHAAGTRFIRHVLIIAQSGTLHRACRGALRSRAVGDELQPSSTRQARALALRGASRHERSERAPAGRESKPHARGRCAGDRSAGWYLRLSAPDPASRLPVPPVGGEVGCTGSGAPGPRPCGIHRRDRGAGDRSVAVGRRAHTWQAPM